MKLSLRCAKCRQIFLQSEDDCFIEFDFFEQKITFICPNQKCRHENIIDFQSWQKKQKHSALPNIGLVSG